ncbi:MAG: YdeI/OmpD-associated family protein [Candidatus Acidiferrum sp.]
MTRKTTPTTDDIPTLLFDNLRSWEKWLAKNHASPRGVWMRFARKGSTLRSVTHKEALEAALCYGWIDGQSRSESAITWLHKFVPRGPRSIWSKINRQAATTLIESGRMKPEGLAAVEQAKQDGRWAAAYEGQKKATVPPDLQAALNKNSKAKSFFATLDSKNRYAVLFRIHTAKKPETRARRIAQFVAMLAKHEKLHP